MTSEDEKQGSLFGDVLPLLPPEQTSREAFVAFDEDNPHVRKQLIQMALGLKRKGHNTYSTKALFEVMRYHRALVTTDDQFKLNNNYTAFYSRELMEEVLELKGFFRTRGSVAD